MGQWTNNQGYTQSFVRDAVGNLIKISAPIPNLGIAPTAINNTGRITGIYTDMRILLGWAWTYLIVSEIVGTTSGITFFINQQARYRQFDNVYAAIMIIGLIGFFSDLVLARLGRLIFPWQRPVAGPGWLSRMQKWAATPGRGLFPSPVSPRRPAPPAV